MTLAQLANFVRIAELRSLSKAAAVVRIAQPALSRQIRNLEIELSSELFVRHAWGVTLTAAGEELLIHARRMIAQAEAAREAVEALATEPAGRVALGVPTSMATALLPPLASVLRERYPKLRPHLADGFSAALHERILTGDLDLAVLYDDRTIGPLATTPLLTENLMLIGAAGASVAPGTTAEMLRGRRLVLPARPNRLRLILDEVLAQQPEGPESILEVDSLPAIISIVRRGEDFTVLPYSGVAEHVDGSHLGAWDLLSPQLSRTMLLARPLGRQPTTAAAVVESEIRNVVHTLADRLRWRPVFQEDNQGHATSA